MTGPQITAARTNELIARLARIEDELAEIRLQLMGQAAAGPTDKANPLGKCPYCNSNVVSRERRLGGNDRCERGHVFPSNLSVRAFGSATPETP